MKIKSSIEICRNINQVWSGFTDINSWKTWYGGEIKSINPSWQDEAVIEWGMGTPSEVIEFDILKFISIKGSNGVISNHYFSENGNGSTEFCIEYDYSESRMSVSDPAQVEKSIKNDLNNFKSYVEIPVKASLTGAVKSETKVPYRSQNATYKQNTTERINRPTNQVSPLVAFGMVGGIMFGIVFFILAVIALISLNDPSSPFTIKNVIIYLIIGIVSFVIGLSIKRSGSGKMTLMKALKANANKEVIGTLINNGVDVNEMDDDGYTPLWHAVINDTNPDMTDLIALLSKAGADVNVKNKYGEPMLVYSVSLGKIPKMEALIKAGADVSATDKYGKTALDKAISINCSEAILLLKGDPGDDVIKKVISEAPQIKIGNKPETEQESGPLSLMERENEIKNQLKDLRSELSILENAHLTSNLTTGPKEIAEIEKSLAGILSEGAIGVFFLLERLMEGITFSGNSISLYNWGEETWNDLMKKQMIIKAFGSAKSKEALDKLEKLADAECNYGQWNDCIASHLKRTISEIKC